MSRQQFTGYAAAVPAGIRLLRGEPRARQQVEEALEDDDILTRSYMQSWMALMDVLEGAPRSAVNRLEQVLVDARRRRIGSGIVLAMLGYARIALGDLTLAPVALKEAERVVGEDLIPAVELWNAQAVLAARRGEWQRSHDLFERVLQTAQDMPFPFGEARFLFDHGQAAMEQGDRERALGLWEDALVIFRRLRARPFVERVERAIDDSHREVGGPSLL